MELTLLVGVTPELESPPPMFICPSGKFGSINAFTIPSLGGSRSSDDGRIGRPVKKQDKRASREMAIVAKFGAVCPHVHTDGLAAATKSFLTMTIVDLDQASAGNNRNQT